MIDERLTEGYIDKLERVDDLKRHAKLLLFRDRIYSRPHGAASKGRKMFYHMPCPRCITGIRMWFSGEPVPSCCRECLEDC